MRKSTALVTSLVMLLVCGVQSLVAVNSAGAASSIRIAIAYDVGGRGDHGINDAVAVGVDAIKKKFGLTSLAVREMVTDGTESDRESRLQFLASAGYSLIVAVGPNYAQAVNVVSLANPNTQFALIDDDSVGNLNLSDMVLMMPMAVTWPVFWLGRRPKLIRWDSSHHLLSPMISRRLYRGCTR